MPLFDPFAEMTRLCRQIDRLMEGSAPHGVLTVRLRRAEAVESRKVLISTDSTG